MTSLHLVLAVVGLITAAAIGPAVPQDQQARTAIFALRIEAMCGDTVDTTTAALRRRTTSQGEVEAKVPMTAERLRALDQLVSEARLFDYPAYYNPPFEGAFSVPYGQYKISVQVSGRHHEIEWHAMRVETTEAKRLATFVRGVFAVFRDEAAVQALPPGAPCL